ncbi:MAG: outer membrane beta-barrel protein, partial [Pseudomonadota bacterium]
MGIAVELMGKRTILQGSFATRAAAFVVAAPLIAVASPAAGQEAQGRAVGAERIVQADTAPGTPVDGVLTAPRAYSADVPGSVAAPVQSGAETFNIPSEVLYAWSGPYVGLRTGVGFAENNAALTGTLEVGYDFNPVDRVVTGLEADISLLGDTSPLTDTPAIGTITGRLGFLPTDRILIFGEAGAALGQVTGATATGGTDTRLTPGYTLGAGAEFALNDTLTFVGEYTYTDLEDRTVPTGTDTLQTNSFEAGIK